MSLSVIRQSLVSGFTRSGSWLVHDPATK